MNVVALLSKKGIAVMVGVKLKTGM